MMSKALLGKDKKNFNTVHTASLYFILISKNCLL